MHFWQLFTCCILAMIAVPQPLSSLNEGPLLHAFLSSFLPPPSPSPATSPVGPLPFALCLSWSYCGDSVLTRHNYGEQPSIIQTT